MEIKMKNQLIALTTALSIAAATTAPTLANDDLYSFNDNFAKNTGVRAGLYLSLPFNGGIEDKDTQSFKYGASFGVTTSFNTNSNTFNTNSFGVRQQYTVNMADLSFNSEGFKAFNLGGQELVTTNKYGQVIFADEEEGEESDKGVPWGKIGVGSLAVVGGLAIIAAGALIIVEDSLSEY